MAQKTKKMTLKYWNSLSDSSKKRALQYCFPIHKAIVEMLMNEKPDLKSGWWQMVFKKVRIPGPGSYYKTVVNNRPINNNCKSFVGHRKTCSMQPTIL